MVNPYPNLDSLKWSPEINRSNTRPGFLCGNATNIRLTYELATQGNVMPVRGVSVMAVVAEDGWIGPLDQRGVARRRVHLSLRAQPAFRAADRRLGTGDLWMDEEYRDIKWYKGKITWQTGGNRSRHTDGVSNPRVSNNMPKRMLLNHTQVGFWRGESGSLKRERYSDIQHLADVQAWLTAAKLCYFRDANWDCKPNFALRVPQQQNQQRYHRHSQTTSHYRCTNQHWHMLHARGHYHYSLSLHIIIHDHYSLSLFIIHYSWSFIHASLSLSKCCVFLPEFLWWNLARSPGIARGLEERRQWRHCGAGSFATPWGAAGAAAWMTPFFCCSAFFLGGVDT